MPLIFLLSFVASVAFGFVLGRHASAVLILVLALVGICVGVVTNAEYDFALNGVDHNLFPIEIIFAAILILPGMLVGLVAAWRIKPA